MPTSKKGMAVYQNYVNGTFNNSTAFKNKDRYYDDKLINNESIQLATKGILHINQTATKEQVMSVFQPLSVGTGKDEKADSRASVNSVNAGLIDDYLMPKTLKRDLEDLSSKTLLVSSTPNPLGQEVRSAIDKSTVGRGTVTDLSQKTNRKFKDLVSNEGRRGHYYSIGYWINKNSGTDMFKQIDISMKKKK
ncbi:hypothetical protein CS528_00110 [Mesoplasma entomophilum]|uniref:Uncharacterized protein n=2 Tax=Mesoplasma entomophilum TaxID=2149 RepID=A0A3S5XYU9_9MOLU|nr:hypothetical protein CS528_00110 [Mesoplasma entomophilum]